MKQIIIAAVLSFALVSCSESEKTETTTAEITPVELNSSIERMSFALGADQGRSISGAGDPHFEKYNLAKVTEGFTKGLKDDSAFDEACQITLRKLFGETGRDFNEEYKDEGCECLGKLSGVLFNERWTKKGGFEYLEDKTLIAGFQAALNATADASIDRQDQIALVKNFIEDLNKKNGEKLLQTAAEKPNTRTVDGVIIETLVEGKGKSPSVNDHVKAHYILINAVGDTLQSSFDYERQTGQAMDPFQLTHVIKGWQIGIPQMKEGGKYMLYVPYHLAYGNQGMFNPQRNAYDIQPYENLQFYIELVKVGR